MNHTFLVALVLSVLIILVATIRKERLTFVSMYSVSDSQLCSLKEASIVFGLRSKQAVISSQGFPANLEAMIMTKIGPVFPELPTSKL